VTCFSTAASRLTNPLRVERLQLDGAGPRLSVAGEDHVRVAEPSDVSFREVHALGEGDRQQPALALSPNAMVAD
jgi:hypothetical protein